MDLSAIQIAEILLRIAITTALAIVAVLFYRARSSRPHYSATALLALCIIGYVLAPILLRRSGLPPLAYPAVLLATMVPVAFWYFCCNVFLDRFRLTAGLLTAVVVTALLAMAGFLTGDFETMDSLDWFIQGVKLLWLAAAFWIVFRDWRSDLVTPRIRLRRLLVCVAGVYITAIIVVEVFLSGPPPAQLDLFNISLIFVLVSACVPILLTVNQANPLALIAESPATHQGEVSVIARRVLEAMEEQRAFAIEGITLDKLAGELDCQPQQLRQAINSELGHRNFNAFINLYRVQEIAARMATAQYRDTPLLTLALDAGFRSLAPFNRSFREHFQVTPSEFRASLETQQSK